MKPPKEYLKNLKHHTITEKMLSDCIYSINNRALNSRDNEYKYTHYIPIHIDCLDGESIQWTPMY